MQLNRSTDYAIQILLCLRSIMKNCYESDIDVQGFVSKEYSMQIL